MSTDDILWELDRIIYRHEGKNHLSHRKELRRKRKVLETELLNRGMTIVQVEDALAELYPRDNMQNNDAVGNDWTMPTKKNLKSRIMYIEQKSGNLIGPARIGRVYFSKTGKSVYYKNKRFRKIRGFKSNYEDVETGEDYWISGPRKDKNDRLYGGQEGVNIDLDVKEEYLELVSS